MTSASESKRLGHAVLVDGHVHYHDCFELAEFLEATWTNIQQAADRTVSCDRVSACLLVAEISGLKPLERIRRAAVTLTAPWSLAETAEELSLVACRDGEPAMAVVAGRQITSAEGLESLALACDYDFDNGRPLDVLITQIQQSGAIPVLPWGAGKWLFRRGRLVANLLRNYANGSTCNGRLFMGDNAGRPRQSPRPALFRTASSCGIPILPGTDPLDLSSHVRHAGRYGFVMPCQLDVQAPARQVRRWLGKATTQLPVFGQRETLASVVRSQCAIRVRKFAK